MILFFYNVALLAALVASAPWWLWRMATTEKYREGLGERLGRVPERLQKLAEDYKPVIWLHAVSVGEVLAVSRLVQETEAAFPGHRLLVSTTTKTGQALARERFGAERVFYCPLDLPWAVRAYLKALKPAMLVLAETEFWPNLLSGCFRRGIPLAVVNARISDRSWPRYQMLRRLWMPILGQLNRVLAQSELDAERLKALGCRAERVSVSGNLKFDVRVPVEAEATRQLKSLGAGLRFVVAGSTLEGEEAALLEAWPRLLRANEKLVMVLAARHPERFGAVAGLLERSGIAWVRRSEWKGKAEHDIAPLRPGQIVLLDTIGELASIYSLAAVAFVGGSIAEAGGHNPLEPAQFAVPVVMGPHYANFRAITEDLRAHDALRIASKQELAGVLAGLLTNADEARAMGQRARQVFEAQAGATMRSVEAIWRVLFPGVSPIRKPIDSAIRAEAKRLKDNGNEIEAILRFLRANGVGQGDCVALIQETYGFDHAHAKEIVCQSTAWKDRLDATRRLHEQFRNEIQQQASDPDSGVSIDHDGTISIDLNAKQDGDA